MLVSRAGRRRRYDALPRSTQMRPRLRTTIDPRKRPHATTVPPTFVAAHDEGTRSFEGIHLEGSLIYVATHDDGLRIYDVSDPENFVLHGSLGGFANAWALDKQGDWVAVADAEGGLRLVDVTDPTQPVLTATNALFRRAPVANALGSGD